MGSVLAVLVDPILPVFAILAFGFAMGRSGRISVEEARLINRFAMSVLLPIMIFGLIATAPVRSFSVVPLAVYAGAEALVFAAGFWLARVWLARPAPEALLLAFGGIFANNAFYVLPIARLLHGDAGALPVTAIVTLDATVTFAAAIVALQVLSLGQVSLGMVAARLAGTPLLQAILAGFAVALAGVALPGPVKTFLDFNGAAAAPVALFALGVVLSQTPFRADRTVAVFAGVKLVAFPAAVAVGLALFAGAAPGQELTLLGAAGPAGAMAFSLALLYGVRTDAIAQVIVWTSLLTLPTLALLA
ncbi:hypothetical protein LNKW23_00970 [Paralimibaculum aggregatum]|uniref:AEC family transporter n=1 Tax=Paralimibaculum aggregatum TaxID=3036245 RepID=A0ABQ6LF82_9RHOB|nr:AEC family transporter [Limibaculum sp. NKW23]GMG80885.1 hypothetical protein LNKW23_00970 [Limibaculum sp. NKW23]